MCKGLLMWRETRNEKTGVEQDADGLAGGARAGVLGQMSTEIWGQWREWAGPHSCRIGGCTVQPPSASDLVAPRLSISTTHITISPVHTLELWWGLNQLIHSVFSSIPNINLGFPGGSDGKESACNAGGPDLISVSGRSLREGNGNPLQYSCLENSTDRGAWWATVRSIGLQRVGHERLTFSHLTETQIS